MVHKCEYYSKSNFFVSNFWYENMLGKTFCHFLKFIFKKITNFSYYLVGGFSRLIIFLLEYIFSMEILKNVCVSHNDTKFYQIWVEPPPPPHYGVRIDELGWLKLSEKQPYNIDALADIDWMQNHRKTEKHKVK